MILDIHLLIFLLLYQAGFCNHKLLSPLVYACKCVASSVLPVISNISKGFLANDIFMTSIKIR